MTVVRTQLNQILKMGLIGLIFFACNSPSKPTDTKLKLEKGEVHIQFKESTQKSPPTFLLYRYSNNTEILIDTLQLTNELLRLDAEQYALTNGMHKIENVSNQQSFRFFYEKEEGIYLETTLAAPEENMTVKLSEANRVFYQYLQEGKNLYKRAALLADLLTNYPVENAFYQATKKEFEQVKKDYYKLLAKNENTDLAISYIQLTKPIFPIPHVSSEEINYWARANFWQQAAPIHPNLLKTNALGNSILTYLSFWKEPDAKRQAQETLFKQAADTVIKTLEGKPALRSFAISFLIDGFKENGFEQIANTLMSNYEIDENCALANSFTNNKITVDAKTLQFLDDTGDNINLEELYTPDKKLVFWSATCEHCHRFLERALANNESSKFILISVDDNPNQADKYLVSINWPEPTFSIKPQNRKEVFIHFQIEATPSIFQLDEKFNLLN